MSCHTAWERSSPINKIAGLMVLLDAFDIAVRADDDIEQEERTYQESSDRQ